MERRRTIREYLDNPRLLSEISIEELQFWADEVPYGAIIHQLMAMKVVQEEHTPESREILQRATLQSPNPDRLSRQLHRLAADATSDDISHTYPDASAEISTTESENIEILKTYNAEEGSEEEQAIAAGIVDHKDVEEVSQDATAIETKGTEIQQETENELSEFSQWLLGLKKVAHSDADDTEGSSILTGHQDIASETLAELLVQQGYTKRAIAMYEQLSLKYPEKSSSFAVQIQKIQGL